MDDLISRSAAITAIQKAYADTEGGTDKCAVWKNVGLTNALHIMQDLPSAQPDFNTVEKIDKAYDDGYKCGYLQAKSDYETYMRGEQDG